MIPYENLPVSGLRKVKHEKGKGGRNFDSMQEKKTDPATDDSPVGSPDLLLCGLSEWKGLMTEG